MNWNSYTKKELINFLESYETYKIEKTNTPNLIYEKHLRKYGAKKQEHFIVICLNNSMQAIKSEMITIGLVNRTLVHPREVFCPAIENRATYIIIAHNHPSGNLNPSDNDIALFKSLKEAGEILGIGVVDSIIFNSKEFLSMKEAGYD